MGRGRAVARRRGVVGAVAAAGVLWGAVALVGCTAEPGAATVTLESSCDDLWGLVNEAADSLELVGGVGSASATQVHLDALGETLDEMNELPVAEELSGVRDDLVAGGRGIVREGAVTVKGGDSAGLDEATAEFQQALLEGGRVCGWE